MLRPLDLASDSCDLHINDKQNSNDSRTNRGAVTLSNQVGYSGSFEVIAGVSIFFQKSFFLKPNVQDLSFFLRMQCSFYSK